VDDTYFLYLYTSIFSVIFSRDFSAMRAGYLCFYVCHYVISLLRVCIAILLFPMVIEQSAMRYNMASLCDIPQVVLRLIDPEVFPLLLATVELRVYEINTTQIM